MRTSYGKLALIAVAVLLVATGCVSNKRYNRDINTLQSQVNTLASEIARVDSQGRMPTQIPSTSMPRMAREAASADFVSSAMYRTPSGFELPAADIQRALKGAGYYDGAVDGKIGPKTRDALKMFQQDNGLDPDGVCGRKTWDLLKNHLSSSAIK